MEEAGTVGVKAFIGYGFEGSGALAEPQAEIVFLALAKRRDAEVSCLQAGR